LRAVCEAVRTVVGDRKIILKIGYLKEARLTALVEATAEYVDAYAAINTIPVNADREGLLMPEHAFGPNTKAGLSGTPIAHFALRAIRHLSRLRKGRDDWNFGIIGIGGITLPSDVVAYIRAGADVVQATSVFFRDPYFGIKVRSFLAAEHHAKARTLETDLWVALTNSVIAAHQLRGEYDSSRVTAAAQTVLLRWQADQHALLSAGPLKSLRVPTSSEFRKLIIEALRGR